MITGQFPPFISAPNAPEEAHCFDGSCTCCLDPLPVTIPPTSPTTVVMADSLPLLAPFFSTNSEHTLSTQSTLSQQSLPKRKSVAFSNEIWLYRSDRTEEEVQNSWYSRDEVSAFKDERRLVIQMLRAVNFQLELIDESTCCLRGYEAYFSVEYNKATKFVREAALRAVLSEQHRQRSLASTTTTTTNNNLMMTDVPVDDMYEPYRLSSHDESEDMMCSSNHHPHESAGTVTSSAARGLDCGAEALRLACRETSEWAFRNARELGASDEAFAHHLYRIEFCCR